MRDHQNETKQTFEGVATRSAKLERYDLIPPEAERALALRFGIGWAKHGESGWKTGGVEFIKACINHGKSHVNHLLATEGALTTTTIVLHGQTLTVEEDDVGAMLWNASALAWFRAHKPEAYRRALQELHHGLLTNDS